jgi:hypothetical protein
MTDDGTCFAHKKVMTKKAALYASAIQCISLWKGEVVNAFCVSIAYPLAIPDEPPPMW